MDQRRLLHSTGSHEQSFYFVGYLACVLNGKNPDGAGTGPVKCCRGSFYKERCCDYTQGPHAPGTPAALTAKLLTLWCPLLSWRPPACMSGWPSTTADPGKAADPTGQEPQQQHTTYRRG